MAEEMARPSLGGDEGTKQNQTFWRENMPKTQRERHMVTFSNLLIISWLGIVDVFQTAEDLGPGKDM